MQPTLVDYLHDPPAVAPLSEMIGAAGLSVRIECWRVVVAQGDDEKEFRAGADPIAV